MQKRSSTNSIFLPPLFDSITDEVLIVDREYHVAWFNKAFKNEYEKKFGSSISVGDMVSTLQSEPASSIVILDTWQRVFSGGEFSITEQHKGKTDTYMELRFVPIKDVGEKVVAAAVFIKDVTFIRRAEIDLIQSRIILQESQHIAKLTRWTFEVGSATIDWDNTFHEVFGVSFKTEKTKENFFNGFFKFFFT
jgi:PAS domain-containing protein